MAATFEIATKADQALLLPVLLIASFLEQSVIIPPVNRDFIEGMTLPAVAEWVKRSESLTSTEFLALQKPMDELDAHLTLRSHILGYSLSVADLAVWGAIRGNRVTHASVCGSINLYFIKKTTDNVSRWFNYIEETNPTISEIVGEITIHAAKRRAAASAAGASYEIDLPDTGGPIVTRFPPEPSGYLHIGHAKAALLNDYFAHKHVGGTLLCRFDDTNPSKESMEFEDAILYDLKLMEIVPKKTTHSSDYFQEIYEFALKLIKDGKAFADDSELGKGDESRKNRMPSKRRDLGIDETLEHFAEMKAGSEEGRRWCLRARIAYDSQNGTLRDPVIYRCNLIPHHRTGTQWAIYPTYDFCAPILDALEGVTVALRTNEYRDRNSQYEWMQDALGLRKVPIWDFSRFNLIRTVLSKRKLTKIVDEGKVWGWDDPRMPTIRGILRRGMTVPALRKFILKQGPSKNILNLEWGALWAMNKKYIDPEASRHTAILQEQAVHCRVSGIDGPDMAIKPKYVKNPALGSKKVTFQKDEEITLMNWGNAYVRGITKDAEGKVITAMELELHLAGDFKNTKKVTWLAAASANLVPVDIVSFDYLITKDKLEKEDTLENFLTPVTKFRDRAFADCNMIELPQGAIIQFERKGYYKLDIPYKGDGSRMVFFNIPSGKS
ncbi:tRNA synthetases class I, catalytic domain-containing protein [Bisporella sp. PMI_857]|nr:tRNA synthetases class I, catalytic domain-containing protein [Bisporella sp. PMI_857]